MPEKQRAYIQDKVAQGWTPDVMIGRAETAIDCSVRTLYRMFKNRVFDAAALPMKGKRKLNGHKERRYATGTTSRFTLRIPARLPSAP